MDIGIEIHIEYIQAYVSECWLKHKQCPFIAMYVNSKYKPKTKTYDKELLPQELKELIKKDIVNYKAKYVFTIYPSVLAIDTENGNVKTIQRVNSKIKDSSQTPCLVMILNKCDGNNMRIWVAETMNDNIGFWLQFDESTLMQKETF
jgi:sporulation protein YlmC with PRC-barrel domain